MPNTQISVFGKKKERKSNAKGPKGLVSATNVALRKFQGASKNSASKNAASTPKIGAESTSESSKPETLCLRMPVILKHDFLEKAYSKKPKFVIDAVLGLMATQPAFAKKVLRVHNSREKLLKQYNFGRDILEEEGREAAENIEDDDDFMEVEENADVVKKNEMKAKREKKTKKEVVETETDAGPPKAAKNSLKLMRSYVLSFDSKSKCKPGHEHKPLKSGDPLFWIILLSKFFNFAQHALPLMDDPETKFNRETRDQVCLAAIGCKYDTLVNYRDVIWLRCCSKPVHEAKAKNWKGRETQTSRKGALHDEVKTALKEFKNSKACKNRKANLKLQDLFLKVFPGFKASPTYKL